MPISDPIPVEDATRIERHDDGTRTYSDPLLAAASHITGATWLELVQVFHGLYDGGYALVKVLPERPPGTFNLDDATVTLAQLRAAVEANDGDYSAALAQLEREVAAAGLVECAGCGATGVDPGDRFHQPDDSGSFPCCVGDRESWAGQ